jgi:hypothetical protein
MRGVLKPQAERIANDAYFTPQPLADEICRRLAEVLPVPVAFRDPCSGGGAFVDAARKAWLECREVVGTDLPECDFLKDHISPFWSLIASNPPYLLAEEFVRRALGVVCDGGHVAFLLRLSFLAGQKRRALYEQHRLRFLIPITPRPSFTPDGKTDASEYAVFVWRRGQLSPPQILPHLVWRR